VKLDAQKLLDDLSEVVVREEEADGDKEKNSKVFTGEELAKAAASLDVKSTTLAVSEPLTVKSTTASEPLAVKKKKKKKVQETEEVRPKRKRKAEALPPQDLGYTPSSPSQPKCSPSDTTKTKDASPSESFVAQPSSPGKFTPDDIFSKLDLTISQSQVQAAFATGKQEEEFVEAAVAKTTPEEDDGSLPGWGRWTGEGVKARRKRKREPIEPIAPKAKRVQKFEGVDVKSMKYCAENIPHEFQSQKQYEESLRMPSGRDWNPVAVHKKKIIPRVITRAGAVITPLQYAKHLPPKERETLLQAWTAKRPERCKARL